MKRIGMGIAGLVLFMAGGASAAETAPTRGLALGLTLQSALSGAAPQSGVGYGLAANYEFILSPAFTVAIHLDYRSNPSGTVKVRQAGYGLILKHHLGFLDGGPFRPYVDYGLLLQISFIGDRPGSGTSHDTRLALGTDLALFGQIFFVEAAYHYSRIRHFEQEPIKMDYVESVFGWKTYW